MKFLVLLALVGVASCRTSLIGADRARDVDLKYTYVNDEGKEVRVKVEAGRLGLSLRRQPDSELDVEKEVISDGEEASDDAASARRVAAGPAAKAPAVPPRYAQAEAAPRTRLVQKAPRRQETRFVQVGAVPAPQPEVKTRFVQAPAAQPQVEPRFVQVEAVPAPRREVETRFVHVPVPQPEVETRFVQVEAVPAPRREVETRFVQVEAVPAPRREVETRFVQVEAVPSLYEAETRFVQAGAIPAPRREVETRLVHVPAPQPEVETRFIQVEAAPAPPSFVQVQPQVAGYSAGRRGRRPALRGRFYSSDDNSAEK
ncbi:cytadherence high molecular weight protein 1 [Penaeus vannamei]|uniref:cytadherence high molecular weight protein 1 n=1 Tax=Penaeus vannamei TaxID=6689 RepID=UPI00387F98E6